MDAANIKKKIPSQFYKIILTYSYNSIMKIDWMSLKMLVHSSSKNFKHFVECATQNITLRRKFPVNLRHQDASLITEDGASLLWNEKPDIFLKFCWSFFLKIISSILGSKHNIKKKIPSRFASGCVTNNGGWCVTFMKCETRYFLNIWWSRVKKTYA